jgi:hypothetical protein
MILTATLHWKQNQLLEHCRDVLVFFLSCRSVITKSMEVSTRQQLKYVVTNLLKDHRTIFRVKQSKTNDYLRPMIKTLWSFKMSATTYQSVTHNIQKEFNLQAHCSLNRKSNKQLQLTKWTGAQMGEWDPEQRAITVFLQQKVKVYTVKHTLKECRKYGQFSFYARVTFLKKLCKLKLHKFNTKFPLKTVHFLGFRGLTTSSYVVYDYTTSGHTDL